MAFINTLYPPNIPNTYPAFLQNGQSDDGGQNQYYKIYFSIPNLNNIEEINLSCIQVSLRNQRTNQSVLDKTAYYSEILVTEAIEDLENDTNYNYYVKIPLQAIDEGILDINQLYKIQLRFTLANDEGGAAIPAPADTGSDLSAWLNTYTNYFSEWSRAGLIKVISTPSLSVNNFTELGINTLNVSLTDLIGQLKFSSRRESEILKSYKVYLKDQFNNILYETDEIYTNILNNPNEINQQITYLMLDKTNYLLEIKYTTSNLYTNSEIYLIYTDFISAESISVNLSTSLDEENGVIDINLYSDSIVDPSTQGLKPTELIIRRASSETNFKIWEDWKFISIEENNSIDEKFHDITIESSIWYKYGVQGRAAVSAGYARTNMIQSQNPIMCIFDDIFLTKDNQQLKIKFNPNISQFKYNVLESQQNTLGGKFPYITRNGNNYYRTFSIGGLISAIVDFSDDDSGNNDNGNSVFVNSEKLNNNIQYFKSEEEIYGGQENTQLYNNYNSRNGISAHQDLIFEREFRKKVFDFLYKDDIKLFRSTQQGNMLIKLTSISFEPINELGRLLYSFSAAAVEIDENNLSNYKKYQIYSIE